MKIQHGCQHSNTFCWGSSLKVKFLGQPQTLKQETWPLENSNLCVCVCVLFGFVLLVLLFCLLGGLFLFCPPYKLLPQITLFWIEIIDQPVHFFIVVQIDFSPGIGWV